MVTKPTMQQSGPEIDEATARQLSILIHDHIKAMQVWERKLTTPFMRRTKFSTFPEYPKPTLATVLQIMVTTAQMKLEVLKVSTKFLQQLKEKQ